MSMLLKTRRLDDVVILDLSGRITMGEGTVMLRDTLQKLLAEGDRKFLVNLEAVDYIDSSGLGVLVSLSKKIREQGGELRLANLNDDLKTLFELTKLDTLFQIADSRERALDSF